MNKRMTVRIVSLFFWAFAGVLVIGCKEKTSGSKAQQGAQTARGDSDVVPTGSTPSEAHSAPKPASSSPSSLEEVRKVLNPTNLPEYDGPTGAVEGTIRMKGDPAPELPLQLDPGCMLAGGMYGRLFREGSGRVLADVMVAVTGYEGYVSEKKSLSKVNIEGCAFSARTIVMTLGQRLQVQNIDKHKTYLPSLVGARSAAMMAAVPMGDPVNLYADKPGRYMLIDNLNNDWMRAEVMVVKFPTHDVTGIDGRYRIEGIPVGQVSVDAWLPMADLTKGAKVTIEQDKTAKMDLELTFSQAKYDEMLKSIESSKPSEPENKQVIR